MKKAKVYDKEMITTIGELQEILKRYPEDTSILVDEWPGYIMASDEWCYLNISAATDEYVELNWYNI